MGVYLSLITSLMVPSPRWNLIHSNLTFWLWAVRMCWLWTSRRISFNPRYLVLEVPICMGTIASPVSVGIVRCSTFWLRLVRMVSRWYGIWRSINRYSRSKILQPSWIVRCRYRGTLRYLHRLRWLMMMRECRNCRFGIYGILKVQSWSSPRLTNPE